MPIYDFKCDNCEKITTDVMLGIMHKPTEVPVCCEQPMNYYITTPPMVHWKDPVIEPFRSIATKDKPVITTTRQKREYMARHDLIDANDLGTPPSHEDQEKTVAEMQQTIDAITPKGQVADEMKKRGMLDIVE